MEDKMKRISYSYQVCFLISAIAFVLGVVLMYYDIKAFPFACGIIAGSFYVGGKQRLREAKGNGQTKSS